MKRSIALLLLLVPCAVSHAVGVEEERSEFIAEPQRAVVRHAHNGRVLDAPFPLPGVRSPQNPFLGAATPNLARSKGFEGMAISPNGKVLYPLLEGALTTDPDQRRLIINEFSIRQERYTGRQWFYRLEDPAFSIGDMTAVTDDTFLIIERDNFEGDAAMFKKTSSSISMTSTPAAFS